MILVETIKYLLLGDDYTAYHIEKETGVSRTTISNLRNGKADFEKLQLDTLLKLQAWVETLDLEDLFDDIDDELEIKLEIAKYMIGKCQRDITMRYRDAWDYVMEYKEIFEEQEIFHPMLTAVANKDKEEVRQVLNKQKDSPYGDRMCAHIWDYFDDMLDNALRRWEYNLQEIEYEINENKKS